MTNVARMISRLSMSQAVMWVRPKASPAKKAAASIQKYFKREMVNS
jgi:hypothetical protein